MTTFGDYFGKVFRVCWLEMNFFLCYINCGTEKRKLPVDICGLLFVLIERALHNAKRFQINFDFDNKFDGGSGKGKTRNKLPQFPSGRCHVTASACRHVE